MLRERNWVRNPKHRKYKPGEEDEDARSLRNEEASGQEEVQGDEEQQPEEGDG